MHGKLVVITGGNTGIGKETARALSRQGARVVIGCRDVAKGERAAAEITAESGREVAVLALDLASFASIRAFAEQVLDTCPRVDVLLLNAGVVLGDRRETADGFEATFGINHLGHFLLTELLLDRVKASAPSRIVVVSSDAHRRAKTGLDWDELAQRRHGYSGWQVYCESKLANVLFTRELARRLEGTGVTVNALHPGVVATEFAQGGDVRGPVSWFFRFASPFLKTPAQGAVTSIFLASSPEVDTTTGGYFKDCQEVKPNRAARDDHAARRLWEESERLIAIRSHGVA